MDLSQRDNGDVYTWGWKECVPCGKVIGDTSVGQSIEKDGTERQNPLSIKQGSRSGGRAASNAENKGGEEISKRRRVSAAKQVAESSAPNEETLTTLPSLVALNPGVRISSVAAGGRHTLALSDVGQVWGWGYGGEGRLGLGSRIRMVSSPHPVQCIDSLKDKSTPLTRRGMASERHGYRIPGNYVT